MFGAVDKKGRKLKVADNVIYDCLKRVVDIDNTFKIMKLCLTNSSSNIDLDALEYRDKHINKDRTL